MQLNHVLLCSIKTNKTTIMKKLTFLPVALLLSASVVTTILSAQTSISTIAETKDEPIAKNKALKEESFMDRYYELKNAHPGLTTAFGHYAAASHTQKIFVKRYNQIKAAYPKLSPVWGNYAGSEYTLEDFTKKYYEIAETYPALSKYYGEYAGSKKTLPEFIKRYNEIKDSAPDL